MYADTVPPATVLSWGVVKAWSVSLCNRSFLPKFPCMEASLTRVEVSIPELRHKEEGFGGSFFRECRI